MRIGSLALLAAAAGATGVRAADGDLLYANAAIPLSNGVTLLIDGNGPNNGPVKSMVFRIDAGPNKLDAIKGDCITLFAGAPNTSGRGACKFAKGEACAPKPSRQCIPFVVPGTGALGPDDTCPFGLGVAFRVDPQSANGSQVWTVFEFPPPADSGMVLPPSIVMPKITDMANHSVVVAYQSAAQVSATAPDALTACDHIRIKGQDADYDGNRTNADGIRATGGSGGSGGSGGNGGNGAAASYLSATAIAGALVAAGMAYF